MFFQGKNDVEIISDDCILRPLRRRDILQVRAWFTDMDLTREAFGILAPENKLDRLVRDYFTNIFATSMEVLGIWTPDSPLMGFVNYSLYHDPNLLARIGIVIGNAEHRNHGLGTQAMMSALFYLFNRINVHRVELDTASFNIRAQRCFGKCGFVKIGENTDINLINGELVHKVNMIIDRKDFMDRASTYFLKYPVITRTKNAGEKT